MSSKRKRLTIFASVLKPVEGGEFVLCTPGPYYIAVLGERSLVVYKDGTRVAENTAWPNHYSDAPIVNPPEPVRETARTWAKETK